MPSAMAVEDSEQRGAGAGAGAAGDESGEGEVLVFHSGASALHAAARVLCNPMTADQVSRDR